MPASASATDIAADLADLEDLLAKAQRPKVRTILQEYIASLRAEQATLGGVAAQPVLHVREEAHVQQLVRHAARKVRPLPKKIEPPRPDQPASACRARARGVGSADEDGEGDALVTDELVYVKARGAK